LRSLLSIRCLLRPKAFRVESPHSGLCGCRVLPVDPGLIRSQCEILKEVVSASSLDFSAKTRLLNDVDAIAQMARAKPLDETDYRLKSMARQLKETDNGKGEPILTGEQYSKLCGSSDKE
jgi:hypothetical protein